MPVWPYKLAERAQLQDILFCVLTCHEANGRITKISTLRWTVARLPWVWKGGGRLENREAVSHTDHSTTTTAGS